MPESTTPIRRTIAVAGAIDGVLLELHGSLVAEGVPDGDGHILAEVRRQAGQGVPVVAQLDIHSSMSQRMVEMADVPDMGSSVFGRSSTPASTMPASSASSIPEAAKRCHEAGVGATVTLDVDGKSAPPQGPPVRMTAEVMGLSDGRFRFDGPMYAGLRPTWGHPHTFARAGFT